MHPTSIPRTLFVAALFAAAPIATGWAVRAAEEAPPAKAADSPLFARLKSLAGDWVSVDEQGTPGTEVAVHYHVTAGGSALVETLLPDTEYEMVTVYHQDGEDITLTHYCMLGNQPRMRARKDSTADRMVFECIGGTNMKSEQESHMHQVTIHILDDDHFESEWLAFENGEKTETSNFRHARKKA